MLKFLFCCSLRFYLTAMLAFSSFAIPAKVLAEIADTPLARQAMVERYIALYPIKKVMQDTLEQMTAQMPPQQRQQYISSTLSNMHLDVIEKAAAESLIRHFTVRELESLVSFVEKPEGRSALEKMKYYTADLLPVVQREVMANANYGQPPMGGNTPPGGYPGGGYFPPGGPVPGGNPGYGAYPQPQYYGGHPGTSPQGYGYGAQQPPPGYYQQFQNNN